MIDGIPVWMSDLSGWGVVAILVVMLLTGRGLATRREVDAEKARADTWQTAWTTERATRQEESEQNRELLENSRTTVRVLKAIQQAQAERPAAPSESEDSS
jgi:hypothetical protein